MALQALKCSGDDTAIAEVVSCGADRALQLYIACLSKLIAEDCGTDGQGIEPCDRQGCTNDADVQFSLRASDTAEAIALCTKCHRAAVAGLAASNSRKKPGHARWQHMCKHWSINNSITDNIIY